MTRGDDDRSAAGAEPCAAHDDTVRATGFWTMLAQLPAVLLHLLRECWSVSRIDTAAVILCTVAAEVCTAVGLLATNSVLTGLLAAGPTPERLGAAAPGLAAVAGSVLLRALLGQTADWTRARLMPQLQRAVRARVLELTTEVELIAFDDRRFRDTLHRVRLRSVDALSGLLFSGLHTASGVIGLIGVGGVAATLHPILLPLLLVAVVPTWWASLRSARLMYEVYAETSGVQRRMDSLAELMSERGPAAEIRAYTMRPHLLERFDRLARQVQNVHIRSETKQAGTRAVGQGLAGLGAGTVYVLMGVLLYAEVMPLATAGTAVIAIRTALTALAAVGANVNFAYENALFYRDYVDFCGDAEGWRERRGGTTPPPDAERITLRDVTFTYPSATSPGLRGVNLDIAPGEVVALVGENGAGKSTLAKIIASLYRPQHGVVSYGGVPVDEVDLTLLRRRIAVVAQDFTRWPLSMRDNITIGRPDRPDAEAQLAAVAAATGMDKVFGRLDGGVDTPLDPSYRGGTDLSGGQWQRIAIARGLYCDARLLIFDEPTAALDPRMESAIFDMIRRHAGGRTVVLVTHRLAGVRFADRIVVLDQGRVAEQGTHAELMGRGGTYRDLYLLQASSYRENDEVRVSERTVPQPIRRMPSAVGTTP
ncbi:ABC transporter ATP-binding protein [Nocardia sp. NPDC050175]|uniref:ABC transporter ATP-binding protein n=1 Tax=Nocardia sp. NPDC050175 TaxID=3364317 RepID=UPI0037A11914